jgi:mRNA-degrading endonuclease RelE of RelBE toxin-antitoxin system
MSSKKKLEVRATKSFSRNLKHLMKKRHGLEEYVFAMLDEIAANPEIGKVLQGTNGILRKVRIADYSSSKGKKGSLRIIYAWRENQEIIVLCMIYLKSDKIDATPSEINSALAEIESFYES